MDNLFANEKNVLIEAFKNNDKVNKVLVTKYGNVTIQLIGVKSKTYYKNPIRHTEYYVRRSPYGNGNITINILKADASHTYAARREGFKTIEDAIAYITKHIEKQFQEKKVVYNDFYEVARQESITLDNIGKKLNIKFINAQYLPTMIVPSKEHIEQYKNCIVITAETFGNDVKVIDKEKTRLLQALIENTKQRIEILNKFYK